MTKEHFEDIFMVSESDMMPLIAFICFHFSFQCFIFSKTLFPPKRKPVGGIR